MKNSRQQRLPAVFTEDETAKILSSFDRENPMGKRNYAIFLLAARMGLRSCDIKALEFGFINWTEKTVSFTQKKTKKYLTLPLPDDVGWAIIDYLKNGRPVSDSKYVFIQHTPPYGQYKDLRNVLVKQMRKAGIETPANKRIGMHCFRHSLATAMLGKRRAAPRYFPNAGACRHSQHGSVSPDQYQPAQALCVGG